MNPTVSIIVPVYNAEATLSRCVDSVLNQQYTDFELLLVDDGSPDGSGALCDRYAAQDARVRVIHQKNAGVSAARNRALDAARGTYLQFLDSDDWITPDATRSLVRAAEEHRCDLVIADFYRVVGERLSRKGDIDEDTVLTREGYAAHMMENPADFYYGVLWNKLYRRDIVERHHLRMDPEISWCEDFLFNLEYIRWAERFYPLQLPIYYYVKTKGSLATQGLNVSKTVKMKLTVFEYYQQFFKTVLDEEAYERCRLKVYRFLVDAAGDGAVSPLPTARKLGSERVRASAGGLLGQGCLCDAFRERKLLEYHLETAALKNDLALPEAQVLLALCQLAQPCTRRELADFLNLPRGTLTLTLQRLTGRGLLEQEPSPEGEERLPVPTAEASPILRDLELAVRDCQAVRLEGLSGEDQACWQAASRQITQNIQAFLQRSLPG